MRLRFLTAAALALPMALAAQTTNNVTASFKASSARYGGWLAAAFDSIPASKYSYKPTPVQQTIGYVAQHLEAANYGLCGGFGAVKRTPTAKDSLADTIKAMWPKDTLVARLKASLAFCDNALASVDDARLGEELPTGPPGSGRTVPRARFMIGYVTDLAEHYAQIASYMRIIGLVPPSALPRPGR